MSVVWIHCFISAILSVILVNGVQHYDGYTVLRLIPRTETQLNYLRELERNVVELDFWKGPSYLNRAVDVMVPPHLNHTFDRILQSRSFDKTVMIADVEKQIQEVNALDSKPSRNTARADIVANFFDNYQRLANIFTFLAAIQSQYPSISAVETIGKTYEGRDLRIIKIGVNQAANTKPIVFLECGIHAREWISPSTCLFFAQSLVQGYESGNADIVALLQKYDFYILPSLNADGYEFCHTNTRLWRKTRKPYGSCYGADPNRNFGYQWGGEGASANECSETFRGSAPFSEPETKAVSDYVLNRKARVKSYLCVHSYGQYWLYPWGWTSALTPDNAALNRLANVGVSALTAVSNTKYTIGTSTNVLYAAAGGGDDWAYGSAGVKYSYTVELRDTGSYGFTLPASQIRPTGTETTAGFIAFSKALDN